MGGSRQQAAFFMLSRLMQTVEDTTALHRCGRPGLAQLQRDGRLLEAMLTEGFDPVPLLTKLNVEYRAMNLTMGGVADLLGVTFAVLDHDGYSLDAGTQPVGASKRWVTYEEVAAVA
jgi:triphosphoribosyl-dephospho-CoA synthase